MTGQLLDNQPQNTAEMTPMMKQYLEIKAGYTDAILFFRLGDFYEMFFEDAEIAARELELTLTGRGKKESGNRMPMCGIPYHAAENYISRLITKGYKVAICEQVEEAAVAKGLTKREVIKVITPGTLTDENMLTSASNYLAAVIRTELKEDSYGLAFCDASTGVFKTTLIYGQDQLKSELARIEPAEIVHNNCLGAMQVPTTIVHTPGREAAHKQLTDIHIEQSTLHQLEEKPLALYAAAAALTYIKHTQKNTLAQINSLTLYIPHEYMYLDAAARKNLELTTTLRTQNREGSLLGFLDHCKTAMGSRCLKEWLNYPLLNVADIQLRQAAITELLHDAITREEIISFLKDVYDIERLIGRIASGSAHARDLVSLKESLRALELLTPTLTNCRNPLLIQLLDAQLQLTRQTIIAIIEDAIVESPPLQLKDGNVLRAGYNQELDDLRHISNNSKDWILQQEARERERTGIKSLKIGYNSVFGYYIEISNANKDLVPTDYIRKQTLTNAERYITPDLKEREAEILQAGAKIEKLEQQLFTEIRQNIAAFILPTQAMAKAVATLDALLSLALVAYGNNYICPHVHNDPTHGLEIKQGRHPVIEHAMSKEQFIPNDVHLDQQERFILLFGPNMAGKSTYMRQIALLIILAQIGSYIPAEHMSFPIVDRLFTRVGAMDDLFAGKSTFMVEMTETAHILKAATPRSFVILDEVGRGTSTYDGMAIAWAIAEHLCRTIGAKTIFATHYHELSNMAALYPEIKNYNVAVEDTGNDIVFLHKVIPGPASGSYGIHVAKLAGLPEQVLQRAETILDQLQKPETTKAQMTLF